MVLVFFVLKQPILGILRVEGIMSIARKTRKREEHSKTRFYHYTLHPERLADMLEEDISRYIEFNADIERKLASGQLTAKREAGYRSLLKSTEKVRRLAEAVYHSALLVSHQQAVGKDTMEARGELALKLAAFDTAVMQGLERCLSLGIGAEIGYLDDYIF
jgi:uncharacterized protein YozE (UPF0346 family)